MELLVSMGFDEKSSSEALKKCNNNVDQALELLLGPNNFGNNDNLVELDISQYTDGIGISACTPISCSVGLALLRLLKLRATNEVLLCIDELRDALLNGVLYYNSINHFDGGAKHVSFDDVFECPEIDFFSSISKTSSYPRQGTLPNDHRGFVPFLEDIRRLGRNDEFTALVFTKPPETICIIVPPLSRPDENYLLFDSHSRPQFGISNSYLVCLPTVDDVALKMMLMFPPLPPDDGFASEGFYATLHDTYEGNPFQLK